MDVGPVESGARSVTNHTPSMMPATHFVYPATTAKESPTGWTAVLNKMR